MVAHRIPCLALDLGRRVVAVLGPALLLASLATTLAHAQGITNQMRAQLFGPDLQPGLYRIHPINGTVCLGMVGPPPDQFLGLMPCNVRTQIGYPSAALEVLPLAIASFGNFMTLRRPSENACATAAHSVVLGPQRVDIWGCKPNE